MSLRWPMLAAVAALALAAPAAAGVRIGGIDTSGYPRIRVSVTAPLGSAAPRLTENGTPIAGAQVVNLAHDKSVVLAIDRSQSMFGKPLADAASAARAFVAQKAPDDRIEALTFAHTIALLTPFSNSPGEATVALQGLHVDSVPGTLMWDAIVAAAHGLARQVTPGRVIIVVTDGQSFKSSATLDDAVAAAHAAGAAVYPIGIAGADYTPGPLRELAALTGGLYHEVTSTAQLASVYLEISRTLAHTWQITYPTAGRPGDTLHLTASVAGQGTASRTATVAGIADATTIPPSNILPSGVWTSPLAPVVLGAAVGFLTLLAFGFLMRARGGRWLNARLAPHLGPTVADAKPRRRRDRGRGLRGLFAATDRAFANVRQFRTLQRQIERADLALRASELLYVSLGVGFVLGLVGAVAAMPSLVILALMAFGAVVPILHVGFKARARIKAFDNQLPDLLITIAASLKAGHSFRHAVQAVVDEGAEPAAKDFRRVLNETRLGRPMDEALAEMAGRVGSKNLTFVLTAVTIQRQIGGSLAGLFDTVAETVRQRQQFARKIRSLTAMGRMSAYVLIGLPFGVGLALTAMNPTYMSPLWKTSTGHTLVGVALTMMVVGTVILKKIISFKG